MRLRTTTFAISLALSLACFVARTRGAIVEGVYRGSSTWKYVSRFCFKPAHDDEPGLLKATFEFPNATASSMSMLIYYKSSDGGGGAEDEWGAWSKVYGREQSCGEKVAEARKMGNQFYLTESSSLVEVIPGLREEVSIDEKFETRGWISSTVTTRLHTSRNRWFFITVANCVPRDECDTTYCASSLYFTYKLEFTNGVGGSKHFSADETGVLEMTYAFAALYALTTLYMIVVSSRLAAIKKLHVTVKLLGASVFFGFCGVVCSLAYYKSFADDGRAPSWMRYASLIASGISEVTMMLQMMLVAKGWTIVRRKISAQGRMRLAIFVTFYTTCYAVAVVYYEHFMDTVDIAYMYETAPGYIIVVLRLFLFFWVIRAIRITLSKYNKRSFYRKFGFAVGLWALITPFLVCLNLLVDPWVRFKVVYLAFLFFNWWAHICLTLMYDPKQALSASFPFHSTLIMSKSGRGNMSEAAAFDAIAFTKANALSRQVAAGVSMVTMLQRDLRDFLEEASDAFQARQQAGDDAGSGSAGGVEMTRAGSPKSPKASSTLPRDALSPLHERHAQGSGVAGGEAGALETETFPKATKKDGMVSKLAGLKKSQSGGAFVPPIKGVRAMEPGNGSDDSPMSARSDFSDDAPIKKGTMALQ